MNVGILGEGVGRREGEEGRGERDSLRPFALAMGSVVASEGDSDRVGIDMKALVSTQ